MITYRPIHRYKYQLIRAYVYQLPPEYARQVKVLRVAPGLWVGLKLDGDLHMAQHYAWDGPSGPSFDTKTFMRGSLVHDAMYQLLRAGAFEDWERWREIADDLMYRVCIEDGMSRFRARYVWWSLRKFGAEAARVDPKGEPPILTAP